MKVTLTKTEVERRCKAVMRNVTEYNEKHLREDVRAKMKKILTKHRFFRKPIVPTEDELNSRMDDPEAFKSVAELITKDTFPEKYQVGKLWYDKAKLMLDILELKTADGGMVELTDKDELETITCWQEGKEEKEDG